MSRILDNRVTFVTSSDFAQRPTYSSNRIPGRVRKYLPIILQSGINHVHLLKINKRAELNIPVLQETSPPFFFFLNKHLIIRHENLIPTICVSRDLQNFSNKISSIV